MTTVRYGSTLTSSPAAPPVPAGAAWAPPAWAVIRRPSRADSQHRAASNANTPRKTAPCRLAGPTPPSQCMPSGTPSRSWESSVFGFPPTCGDRNSRYMTDRNGHWSSSGVMPANRLVPSRLYSADISRCSRSGCLAYRCRSACSCGASRAWTACPRRARRLSGMRRSRTAIVNAMIAATAARPPRTGVRTPVNPETRWYAASTGTPRRLNMRQRPSSYDGMRAGGGREVRGSARDGGRRGRRWCSGPGPSRRVGIALAQERRAPGLLPQRRGAADHREGGGRAGNAGHRGEQGQHRREHGPGQDGPSQRGQPGRARPRAA